MAHDYDAGYKRLFSAPRDRAWMVLHIQVYVGLLCQDRRSECGEGVRRRVRRFDRLRQQCMRAARIRNDGAPTRVAESARLQP